MTFQAKLYTGLLVLLATFTMGWVLGWRSATPKTAPEPWAPPIRQEDGSLVLERVTRPNFKPRHELPGELERHVQVVVKPAPVVTASGQPIDVPPLVVDLSLVRVGDGRRVVASTPGGEIIGGIDMPVQPISMPRSRPNALGGLWGRSGGGETYGVWYDRDLGPVRLGAEVARSMHRVGPSWDYRLRAGWTF